MRTKTTQKRVLVIHSQYRVAGGEEHMVAIEEQALRTTGYNVKVLALKTKDSLTLKERAQTALHMVRPGPAVRELSKNLEIFDPHSIHFHNLLPNWGYPSLAIALDWALKKGRTVAVTIHNQRWVCANGLFFRNNSQCTVCLEKQNPLWGAVFNCRSNLLESAAYSAAIEWAWVKNLYNHPALTLIALNSTTQARLNHAFPCTTIRTLPNPVTIPPASSHNEPYTFAQPWSGKRLAVVGRLSTEKGWHALLNQMRWGRTTALSKTSTASQQYEHPAYNPTVQFVVAGDGPLRHLIEEEARTNERILYLGQLPENDIPQLLRAVDGFYFGSIVEEQSPTALRLAKHLNVPIWGPAGRINPKDLDRWGELLNTKDWCERLEKILFHK